MKKNIERINRDKLLLFVIFMFFFILFTKLVLIQIFMHSKINITVKKMINQKNTEIARRGDILDSNGKILASSIREYTIFLDPRIIKNFYKVKNALAKNGIEIKENDLKKYKKTSYIPILSTTDYKFIDKIKNKKIKGIGFNSRYIRYHPNKKLLINVLGTIDSNNYGVSGIEKEYNKILHGNDIVTKNIRDGRGYIIRNKFIDKTKICGQNVKLNIDNTIQFITEQELQKALDKYNAKKAICIVQDPKTANILAMASISNNESCNGDKNVEMLKNSAISDVYEPGSTFKIVALSAALEEKIINQSDVFFLENGKYKISNHTIRDSHKIEGYVPLSKAFEQSSNVLMVKIAQKLGEKKFYRYIRKFGFYSLSGIDLPCEASGLLKDIKKWDVLSLPTISFGQGIGVTAIQMINAFSVIANDGVLLVPSIKYNNAKTIDYDNKKIRRVISAKTAYIVKNILKNSVDFGTGKSAKIPGYTVSGKTGTAQKFHKETKSYSNKYYNSSFCGMIPAIKPKIIILVIIDEPKCLNYYASYVASPVFANIAKRVTQYLNIDKDDN